MTSVTHSLNHDPAQTWYIVGAGAVGCLWACALAQAGEAVTLIVREHRLSDINKPQQQVISLSPYDRNQKPQTFTVNLCSASQLVQQQEKTGQSICRLIIATKAYDALQAVDSVLPCISNSAKVISLCNGMGMHDAILKKLQTKADKQQSPQYYLGVTSDGALLSSQYQLTHTGQGETFIGQYVNAESSDKPAADTAFPSIVFNPKKFFLTTQSVNDIYFRAWKKLLVNCVINPLTAKQQCKNGELLSKPNLHQQVLKLCNELANIYQHFVSHGQTGGTLTHINADELLSAVTHIATQTQANSSSMLKDKQAGRRLELDYLNGYIVKLASQLALPCPINQQLIKDLNNNLKHNLNNQSQTN